MNNWSLSFVNEKWSFFIILWLSFILFTLGYQDHCIPFKWDFVTAKGVDVEC